MDAAESGRPRSASSGRNFSKVPMDGAWLGLIAASVPGQSFNCSRARVHRFHNQRIARRPVMPVAGEQPNANRVTARHHPIAVVLDLVNPNRGRSRPLGGEGKAGFDEAGRCSAGAQQHVENQVTGRRPRVESVNCPSAGSLGVRMVTTRTQPWLPTTRSPPEQPGGDQPDASLYPSPMPTLLQAQLQGRRARRRLSPRCTRRWVGLAWEAETRPTCRQNRSKAPRRTRRHPCREAMK